MYYYNHYLGIRSVPRTTDVINDFVKETPESLINIQ